jgi:hypothetical protein
MSTFSLAEVILCHVLVIRSTWSIESALQHLLGKSALQHLLDKGAVIPGYCTLQASAMCNISKMF